MTPVHRTRRLGLIAAGAVLLAGAAYLVFSALEQNVAYFYEPSEALAAGLDPDARIRLGGMVETGSVRTAGVEGGSNAKGSRVETVFRVTDGAASIPVSYTGILPDLFREGQGVVAQGRMTEDGRFLAETILAKHDENYVPRELKDLMEEQDRAGV